MLYELLTGSTPLQRARLRQAAYIEILRRIRDDDTPRPSTRLSESKESAGHDLGAAKMEPARLARLVRGELDWIVMRGSKKTACAATTPRTRSGPRHPARPGGRSVEAGPPSATYRLRKFAAEIPALAIAAAAFAALLVAAARGQPLASVLRDARRARRPRQSEIQAARGRETRERADRAAAEGRAGRTGRAGASRGPASPGIKEATVYLKSQAAGKTLATGTGFVIRSPATPSCW